MFNNRLVGYFSLSNGDLETTWIESKLLGSLEALGIKFSPPDPFGGNATSGRIVSILAASSWKVDCDLCSSTTCPITQRMSGIGNAWSLMYLEIETLKL